MGEGLGESLDDRDKPSISDPPVVFLRPEDESAEGTSLREPAVGDDLHVLVIADEDAILLRGTLEMHRVRRSLGIEIDRAHDIPSALAKGDDQRAVDVSVRVEGTAASHYGRKDSAQD